MAPDLSIVIVSWNTRDLLRDCLASLPAATAGLTSQIIVVDNCSRDGSAAMVRAEFPGCLLLESGGNLGFTRANNLGLGRADGDALLLLNPDTVCPPGSLVRLRRCLDAAPRTAACGPTLLDAAGRPGVCGGDFPAARHHLLNLIDPGRRWLPGRWRRAGLGRVPPRGDPGGPIDYVTGACLMIAREAWAAVGPLDERFFMYFEETDWCRRARVAGYQVVHCGQIEVVHLEGRAAEQASAFALEQFQHSYRLFIAKHHGAAAVWRFRAAIGLEYAAKALWRWLAPGDRPRRQALARVWLRIAAMQLRGRLTPRPPC